MASASASLTSTSSASRPNRATPKAWAMRAAALGPRSASMSMSSSSSSIAWSSGRLVKTAATCSVIRLDERDSPSVRRRSQPVFSPSAIGGRPGVGVLVGMLARHDGGQPWRLLRLALGQSGKALKPRQAALDADLDCRSDALRVIQGWDRDLLAMSDPGEGQRRAAGGAEAAPDLVGALKVGRRAPRPAQVLAADEGSDQTAHRLLAHAAVADGGPPERLVERKAHRTALAAAGERRHAASLAVARAPSWPVTIMRTRAPGAASPANASSV